MKNNIYSPLGQILIKYINCKKTLFNLYISCKFGHLIADEKMKLEYAKKLGSYICAAKGYLNLIKIINKHNIRDFTYIDVYYAIKNGHLEVVKWFYENKTHDFTLDIITFVCLSGELDVVKFLHDNIEEECKIDAINLAHLNGNLNVIEYVKNHFSNK